MESTNTTAYVRAYSRISRTDGRSRRRNKKPHAVTMSNPIIEKTALQMVAPVYPYQCLTFDTETLTTPDKTLLYGFYMITGFSKEEMLDDDFVMTPDKRDTIREVGVFYSDELTEDEVEVIKTHAHKTKLVDLGKLLGVEVASVDIHLRVMKTKQFVTRLYSLARREHLLVIGLNLPFDLSRLLPTPNSWHEGTGKGKGSFCLELEAGKPAIQIYHVGFAKNLYSLEKTHDFAYQNLHFLDLSGLSGALLGPGAWSLSGLGKTLNIPSELRKLQRPEEDYRPSPEKLTYALQDVIATYACYMRLRDLYEQHDLEQYTPLWNLVSGASLGKSYLKKIGIRSFTEQNPNFPQQVIGHAMNAFYGARSEIAVRLKPVRGRLRDFTSLYPLNCSLLGLQRYWLASEVSTVEGTKTVEKVNSIIGKGVPDLMEFLHDPENYKGLVILCKVSLESGEDRFPIRANYGGKGNATTSNIALPYVSSDEPLWYCLPDVIASKLLTGHAPEIIEAIEIVASEGQYPVNSIQIMGSKDATIDLTRDEFFTRVVDLKQEYGTRAKNAKTIEEKEYYNSIKTALKLLANSTSYGSLVEIRVSEPSDKEEGEEVCYYDATGKRCYSMVSRVEEPGKFFSPLGPFITSMGRLMFAIAERLGLDAGLGLTDEEGNKSVFAFGDTDSLFYIKPDNMEWDDFVQRDEQIGVWFMSLSPYANNAEVFKLEVEDAWCFGISAKRYCLYTIEERQQERLIQVVRGSRVKTEKQMVAEKIPYMVKVSSHGLGSIQKPYPDDASPFEDIPVPSSDLKCHRWIYDLFYKAVYAVENGVDITGKRNLLRDPKTGVPVFLVTALDGLKVVCQHQITISSPHLLRTYNRLPSLSPFSFFTLLPSPSRFSIHTFQAGLEEEIWHAVCDLKVDEETKLAMIVEKDRKMNLYNELIKGQVPIYSGSLTTSTLYPLYRTDNNQEVPEYIALKTVGEALFNYFDHIEQKAANGNEMGVMKLRRVHIDRVLYMGKEISERYEETTEEALGLIRDWRVLEFGREEKTDLFIRKLLRIDMHDLMYTTGLTRKTIEDVLKNKRRPSNKTILALVKGLELIEQGEYDNTWRLLSVEDLQAKVGCNEKRAVALLNGYVNFTEGEKILLENWTEVLKPYSASRLAELTKLTRQGINKIKSGAAIPSDKTKVLLRGAIKALV